MLVPELMKHPEWFIWDEHRNVVLVKDAPKEAHQAYQDYLDQTKYEKDNEIDF